MSSEDLAKRVHELEIALQQSQYEKEEMKMEVDRLLAVVDIGRTGSPQLPDPPSVLSVPSPVKNMPTAIIESELKLPSSRNPLSMFPYSPPVDNLVFVSCYTKFDNLAHQPRGTEAKHGRGMYTYRLNAMTGELVLLSITKDDVMNPSFTRFHHGKKILYTVTESIVSNGQVVAYSVDWQTGMLKNIQSESAGGTSTCYITLTKNHMLLVNYWDSTVSVLPLQADGLVGPIKHIAKMPDVIKAQGQSDHLSDRQSEPHNHSLVFDPYFEKVAFVPDLGTDSIRQFLFDDEKGELTYVNAISTTPDVKFGEKKGHGPRYIVFHPKLGRAYVINELSNTVSVFAWDVENFHKLVKGENVCALKFMQNISTLPAGFDSNLSKAGRLAISPNGKFVLVSNRGHDSITTLSIQEDGTLSNPSWVQCHGETPRHFQFDNSGQWVLSVGQDSNNLTVHKFNAGTGKLSYSFLSYPVPSPNFVCSEFASFPFEAN